MDDAFSVELLPAIERFFESENTREVGRSVYDDVFAAGPFFPLQRKRELAVMMDTARAIKPTTVFEIGADKGGGLYHWCKCLPTVERVIACEIRGTPYSVLFEKAFPHLDFLWLPVSSYTTETVEAVRKWLRGSKIDCMFIDGDKSYFDRDFDCYYGMMKHGGIVFMHDIQDTAPRAGYNHTVSKGFKHKEVIDISESNEAMARAEMGVEAISEHENWLRHWKGASAGVGIIYV